MAVCMNSYCSRSRHRRSEQRNAGQQSTSGGASGANAVDNVAEHCEAVQRRPGHIAGLRQHEHNSGGGSYQQRDLTSGSEFDERAIVGSDQRRGLHACNEVHIVVGNEVLTVSPELEAFLVPAMINLHKALVNLQLDEELKVSTPHNLNLIGNSYPPSLGTFKNNVSMTMQAVLAFLSQTKLSLHGERLSLLRLQCKS